MERATPQLTSTVETHYEGTLVNGTVFDSSYKRGETVSFPVNGVIPGWTEALQLMKEGDIWELVIPSDLAYGARSWWSHRTSRNFEIQNRINKS